MSFINEMLPTNMLSNDQLLLEILTGENIKQTLLISHN